MYFETIKCPFCDGKGTVARKTKNFRYTTEIGKKAFTMRKQGETLRTIAQEIGALHPQTVLHILKKYFREIT